MRWILMAAIVFAWCAAAQAADVSIYSGTAEVASQSDGDREAGLRAALRSALVKASGDAQIAQDPGLGAVLGRAGGLLRQYTYRESVEASAEGSTKVRVLLDAEFDPSGVEGALRELGRALWERERPTVLVWLVIDSNGTKQIASSFQQSALGALLSAAAQRGLPLQLPRMDGTDLNRINPVTLWDAPAAAVIAASQRYNATVILVARLQKLATGWTARYTLIDGHEFESWQADDALAAGVLSKAIHGTVDRMARRYAVDNSGPPLGALQVWVEDLRSAADYALVTGYLEKMSVVHDLAPVAAEPSRLLLSMQVDVGAQRLQQLMALDKVLVMQPLATEPPSFALRLAR